MRSASERVRACVCVCQGALQHPEFEKQHNLPSVVECWKSCCLQDNSVTQLIRIVDLLALSLTYQLRTVCVVASSI
jgi:hypothetical protein